MPRSRSSKPGPSAAKEGRKRGKQVGLRLSEEEYERFRAQAEAMDLPLGTWIRLVCRRAAGLPTP